jgi:hypothetical protein
VAIHIVDVKIIPTTTWDDLKIPKDWNSIKNTNTSWQTIEQTAIVGEPIKIEVEVLERTWGSFNDLFVSWDSIKTKVTNWLGLKNL